MGLKMKINFSTINAKICNAVKTNAAYRHIPEGFAVDSTSVVTESVCLGLTFVRTIFYSQ